MKVKFHTASYKADNGSKIYYPYFGIVDNRLLRKNTDDDFLIKKLEKLKKELGSMFPSIELLEIDYDKNSQWIKLVNFFFKEDSDEFYFLVWSNDGIEI